MMSRKISITIIFLSILLLGGIHIARADTSYVTDSFEITLRSGPGSTNKIIRMLHSDQPVKVLSEKGSWSSVQLPDGTQGWVLNRFISKNLPKSMEIEKLQQRNKQLESLSGGAAGQLDALNKEIDSLKTTLATTQNDYQQLQQKYADLKSDTANVLKLKKDYTAAKDRLKQTTAKMEQLDIENKGLRMKSNLEWFLAGVVVVSISWLFGYLMGRSRRKRQSSRLY